jgi:CO dehydrogenase nickel-insertion accessory protein CooC1
LLISDGCLIVGSAGSGKTSLGRTLIEAHMRLGIPVLAFDTTGDLTAWLRSDFGLDVSLDLSETDEPSRIRLRELDVDDVAELFSYPPVATANRLTAALMGIMQYRVRRITPEHALIETIVTRSWDQGGK